METVRAAVAMDLAGDIATGGWTIISAVVISVIATVLVPWSTAQRTKTLERRDQQLAARTEAASRLLKAAGDLFMASERQSEERLSGNVYFIDFHQAAAQVLILTTAGRTEAAKYFQGLPVSITRGGGNFTLDLAEVLSVWIPEGKFEINRLTDPIDPTPSPTPAG